MKETVWYKRDYAWVIGFALLMVLFIWLISTSKLHQIDSTDACIAAQKFVKERLKVPSTAKFQECNNNKDDSARIVNPYGNLWEVRSWVDAQNLFGVPVRNKFYVQLEYSSEEWILNDIQMENYLEESTPDLNITSLSCIDKRGEARFLGEIKNNGDSTAKMVQVYVRFYDSNKSVVGAGEAYIEGYDLPSGGISVFDKTVRISARFDSCDARVIS